jgi:hypothetical protein
MTPSAVLATVAVLFALVAMVWCFAVSRRLREISRVRGDLARMAAEGDLMRLASIVDSRLDALERADERLRLDDAALAERLSSAVRHVGVVRFDALPGTAGMMSFSLALLDDRADGFALTAIYGRNDYRLYAKPISTGDSDHPLTEEETAAIAQAMRDTTAIPVSERRGSRD